MKSLLLTTAIAVLLSACTQPSSTGSTEPQKDSVTTQPHHMNNLISIVEIPVTDFARSVMFYQSVLSITIQQAEMDGVTMGILPNEQGTVNVVLAKGADYKPTTSGVVLYLNAGNDLQPILDKVKQNGGEVIVPKTQINAEMGYFALFIDSEGNKMGLHSLN